MCLTYVVLQTRRLSRLEVNQEPIQDMERSGLAQMVGWSSASGCRVLRRNLLKEYDTQFSQCRIAYSVVWNERSNAWFPPTAERKSMRVLALPWKVVFFSFIYSHLTVFSPMRRFGFGRTNLRVEIKDRQPTTPVAPSGFQWLTTNPCLHWAYSPHMQRNSCQRRHTAIVSYRWFINSWFGTEFGRCLK